MPDYANRTVMSRDEANPLSCAHPAKGYDLSMSLVVLIIVLVFIGVALFFLRRAAWIDGTIKTIIYVVLVAFAIFLVLQAFGVLDKIRGVNVPKVEFRVDNMMG